MSNLRQYLSIFGVLLGKNYKVTIRSSEERQAKNLVLIGRSESNLAKHFDYLLMYAI